MCHRRQWDQTGYDVGMKGSSHPLQPSLSFLSIHPTPQKMEAIHLFSPTLTSTQPSPHSPALVIFLARLHTPTLYCHANPVTTLLISLSCAMVSFGIRIWIVTLHFMCQQPAQEVMHALGHFVSSLWVSVCLFVCLFACLLACVPSLNKKIPNFHSELTKVTIIQTTN